MVLNLKTFLLRDSRFLRLFLLLALVTSGALHRAHAWNPTGHMLIASMTYDQLPPGERSRWTRLLRAHPDFARWQAAEPKDQATFDEGRYLFMRASTWPDDIRKTGSPYDHPIWHHVDYPLEGPDFPLEPAPPNTEDALFAIERCRTVLANSDAPAAEQAAHLSWLIHLVADLQQPLHCGTFVNADFPKPEGDRNGLARYISVGGAPISLHWFWDCLPGNSVDGKELAAQGKEFAAAFPRAKLPELTLARDPAAWSLEGRALCLDVAYLHGHLQGAKQPGPDNPPLPEGYYAKAHALAERRVTLAAYRLTDVLTALAAISQYP